MLLSVPNTKVLVFECSPREFKTEWTEKDSVKSQESCQEF